MCCAVELRKSINLIYGRTCLKSTFDLSFEWNQSEIFIAQCEKYLKRNQITRDKVFFFFFFCLSVLWVFLSGLYEINISENYQSTDIVYVFLFILPKQVWFFQFFVLFIHQLFSSHKKLTYEWFTRQMQFLHKIYTNIRLHQNLRQLLICSVAMSANKKKSCFETNLSDKYKRWNRIANKLKSNDAQQYYQLTIIAAIWFEDCPKCGFLRWILSMFLLFVLLFSQLNLCSLRPKCNIQLVLFFF